MNEVNPFPECLSTNIEKQISLANQKAKELKVLADEAAHIHKALEKMASFFNQEWFLHLLALINKEALLLEKMRANNHSAMPILEEILQTAKNQAEEFKSYRFPTHLEEACRVNNLSLSKDSRHPNYKLKNGFFQLRINDHKRTATLSNTEIEICEIPADIGAIIDTLKSEKRRLFERFFDANKFLKKLRTQYLALLKLENLNDGSTIPIRNITHRLGKNEKGFRTDEFLVDLSRLLEQQTIEIDSRKLELQQTKFSEKGVLIYILDEPKYVGFVLFKKA